MKKLRSDYRENASLTKTSTALEDIRTIDCNVQMKNRETLLGFIQFKMDHRDRPYQSHRMMHHFHHSPDSCLNLLRILAVY